MPSNKIDILSEVRVKSTVKFMSKRWKPVVANKEGTNLTLKDLTPLVRRSVRIRQVIEKLSRATPRLELQSTVITYLEEMGHCRSMAMIRWVGIALCQILKKNYTGIIVDEESIINVKAEMGNNPVIFAPSHRSYADFILMSFLCFYYDIEIPVIAAGQDFLSMWVMGRVLRECCAFFMRRSFVGNDLYKAVIAEYVTLLMEFGHSAMEFFIEGTRSRSGKSLAPKFGLMSMALEPYFFGKVPDVTIVPVSITYECCLEDSIFARELLGIPKPKESTRLLLKALQLMKADYGRIFVEFAPPVSIKEFCFNHCYNDPRTSLTQRGSFFSDTSYPGKAVCNVVKDLCHFIVSEHNSHMTITPFNMLAASMSIWNTFDNLVPYQLIVTDMKFLHGILLKLQISTEIRGPIEEEISECLKLHQRILYHDVQRRALRLHLGLASTSSGTESIWQDHKLSEKTLSQAYPAVLLQQYANPVCLVCIHISIINFILCSTEPNMLENIIGENLYGDYVFFRQIFSAEFALSENVDQYRQDFKKAIGQMKALNMFFNAGQNKMILLQKGTIMRMPTREALLLGLLHPYVHGYVLILEICMEIAKSTNWIIESEMKQIIQKRLEAKLTDGVPKYILCVELINNAVQGFCKVGALQKLRRGNTTGYFAILDLCELAHAELARCLGCMISHMRTCHLQYMAQNVRLGSKL